MFDQQQNFSPEIPLITPVLLLVFNRQNTTKQVFSAIRKAKPSRLYVAGDGPRPEYPEEKNQCEATRSILEKIDWDVEVKTLFQERNLGCRMAVSQAISWFFENESEGIILEDDCLPCQSFFWFCQELLKKFRNNKQIGAICGFYSNELDYKPSTSYFLSRHLRVWGWAGWRRTFESYDSNLNNLIEKNNTWQNDIFNHKEVLLKKYFKKRFDQVANGEIDTWDTQLQYLLWQKNQRVVVSSKNLIQNIGWTSGTHAKNMDHNHNLPTSEINFPLLHPKNLKRDAIADRMIVRKSYRITLFSFLKTLLRKIIR